MVIGMRSTIAKAVGEREARMRACDRNISARYRLHSDDLSAVGTSSELALCVP